jgi:hypothetical protein
MLDDNGDIWREMGDKISVESRMSRGRAGSSR